VLPTEVKHIQGISYATGHTDASHTHGDCNRKIDDPNSLTRSSQLLMRGCALPLTDMPSSPLQHTSRSCRMGLHVVDSPTMLMASVKPTMSTVKLRKMQDLQTSR
jgi:hypothetical protein